MPKVLLTRSEEDNRLLQGILAAKGYDTLECSLISHQNLPFNPGLLDNFTDIIITSKRAALILPDAHELSIIPKNAWVVGSSSAEVLRQKNYNIKYIASSANSLKKKLPADLYEYMIYLAGNNITTKMPYTIKTVEVYQVKYKDILPAKEVKMIKNGVDYILLYSENCAKTLISLIIKNDLLKYLENSAIVAISSKVEKIVKSYFKKTIVARSSQSPTTQILKLLEYYDKAKSATRKARAAKLGKNESTTNARSEK